MSETNLKALMRLFAIVAQIFPVEFLAELRKVVFAYLSMVIKTGNVQQFIIMFDFYHSSLRERESQTGKKQLSLFSVKSIIICEELNKSLTKEQKLRVLVRVLEMLKVTGHTKVAAANDFIQTMAISLHFDQNLYKSCLSFIDEDFTQIPDKENIVLYTPKHTNLPGIKQHEKTVLKGLLSVYHIQQGNLFIFQYNGPIGSLYYNNKKIENSRTYIFEKGGVISSPLVGKIIYSDILRNFIQAKNTTNILFSAIDVSYKFNDSENGIEPFSLTLESGQLIGVMGGSGVGKSTLLNLLNGNLKPNQGKVIVNGYDLNKENKELKGLIGFIPQDDLLIEELTVFQNLYYNARLCFATLNEQQIQNRVHKLLFELDLYEARNLKVGNALNKFISGGQRKRLNVALELIREPSILFVDEPTSGLSSSDSEIMIDLLKNQSIKGKLVITNIHQPSSDIYKTFDKLILMDKGGRIVFFGDPLGALTYLKTYNQIVNANEVECSNCGNINPEQALQILESKKVNEYGEYQNERMVPAQEWYINFKNNLEPEYNQAIEVKTNLPSNDFKPPNRFNQFRIFSIRNLLSKISDKQYMLINLIQAPGLAFILAWFTKFKIGTSTNPSAYIFSENVNLPVYLFMVPIVALFIGMMVAAEDIFRDKKITQRETFLNLSRFSYYNSKVVFMAGLSAIQALTFILIGNSLLHIKGMFFQYWLMFFITAFIANMISLNISATLKSIVAIYILIPLLLVPQILLGGAMIEFDKLNSDLTHPKYVPFIGDIMPSRWVYEALAVNQFKENKYQKELFLVELEESQASYMMNYHLPEIETIISKTEYNIKNNMNRVETIENLNLLSNELIKLEDILNYQGLDFSELKPEGYNLSISKAILEYLTSIKLYYSKELESLIDQKDKTIIQLSDQVGGRENLLKLKRMYHNDQLEQLVLRKKETQKLTKGENEIIPKYEPIYQYPNNQYGRAQFFAPAKRIGSYYIDTYWFNFFILIVILLTFYLTLITNFFPYLVSQKLLKRLYKLMIRKYYKYRGVIGQKLTGHF